MRLITVLNRCTTFKQFVFEGSHFDRHGRMMVRIRPRKNSRAACSGCGHLSPTYDTATEARLFEFVPLWGFPVFLVYRMRRVACKACGRMVVEKVPWSTGKHHLTDLYRLGAGKFLQRWCFRTMRSNIEPDERHRQDAAASSRAHPKLVQGQEAVQQRHCRGLEPEMESDGEKSIRIPHLQGTPNRFVPSAWRFTRTPIHPRILLTSHQFYRLRHRPLLQETGPTKTGASGYGYSLGMEAGRRIAFGENRNLIPRTWLVHTTGFRGQIHGSRMYIFTDHGCI